MMTHIMKRFVESSVSASGIQPDNTSPMEEDASLVEEPQRAMEITEAKTPHRRTPPPSAQTMQRRSVPKSDLAMAIERFQYAMLLAERKTAVSQLQTLWAEAEIPDESHRIIIPVILHALVTDPRDTELMEAMLELMQTIVTMNASNAGHVLNEPHALDTILGLMQDPSPWIRGPTVHLIKRIQDGDSAGFATHILACQEGLRLLLEVIEDKREHIRDTAVQILLNMTSNQTPITQRHVQQFLAFEEGFARLFQIVDLELEGHGIESPVLIDCMQVILNMIQNNTMTQSLLRETPFIQVLFPLLLGSGIPPPMEEGIERENDDEVGTDHVPTGIKCTLDVLACIVGPIYTAESAVLLDEISQREHTKRNDERSSVQDYLAQQYEVVQALGELACYGCENDRKHAMKVLQLLCEENEANQFMLLTLSVSGPAYVLSACLKLDVSHEETDLGLIARTLLDTIWNCELAKISILQHIHAPPPHENGPITPVGRVLMTKLANTMEAILEDNTTALKVTPKDASKIAWKCCSRWRSLLHNGDCKQQALRVAGPNETNAVSGSYFLNTFLKWLMKVSITKAHYSLLCGLYRVIVSWVQGCPLAINEVVASIPTLTFFCETIGKTSSSDLEIEMAGLAAMVLGLCLDGIDGKIVQLTKEQVLGMIAREIGLQNFTDAFVRMQQLESFQNSKRSSDGFVVYDKGFIQLFKHVAEMTRVGILNVYMGTHREEDSRSKAYQDLIRMQDQQLHELQEQIKFKGGNNGNNPLENELQKAKQTIHDLKQMQQSNETRIRGLTQANELVERELQRNETELKRLKNSTAPNAALVPLPEMKESESSQYSLRIEHLEHDIQRLNRQLHEKDEEIEQSRQTIDMLTAHQQLMSTQSAPESLPPQEEVDGLKARVVQLEHELKCAQETHTATVSTLVTRHEQQVRELTTDLNRQFQEDLEKQRSEMNQQHKNELDVISTQREKQKKELNRLENVFDQLQNQSIKMEEMEQELLRLKIKEHPSDDSFHEVLMLLGSMEIQCRCFRDVLEQVLGKEGIDKAIQLGHERGAMNYFSNE